MPNDNPNSDWFVPETAAQEQYATNAKATGEIPNEEDWGKSDGKLYGNLKVEITKADILNYLHKEATLQGMTVEELLAQMDESDE